MKYGNIIQKNPEKSDVITEYKLLEEIKIGIEAELDELKE